MMSVLAVGLVGWTPPAAADITVEVRTISAQKGSPQFDPRLEDLRGQLSKAFAGYTSFSQVDTQSMKMAEKGSGKVRLVNGQEMTLTFFGLAGNLVTLGLNLVGKMNTTLRLSPGSTFFQAGMEYKDGILILAIRVLP
jgi:hypothetical protein